MTRHLEIDQEAYAASFGARPLAVRHSLSEHPLLTVDELARLAEELPGHRIEHNLGKVDLIVADGKAPSLDLPPAEIARGIETNGCWMVLKNIELVPRYKQLLDECLDEVVPLVSDREGGMTLREGFVFLSSSGSITPSHIDPEHNFLLQIRGVKDMHVGTFDDGATAQREIERTLSGGHRNLDRMPANERNYPLTPGDGVYVPPHAPHWVQVGEGVYSVSLSITFRTPTTELHQRVHTLNARLRRLHLAPRPPGRSSGLDRTKSTVYGALKAIKGS